MKQSGKVALGGVMGAVALICLLGTVFPYATYALPAMAGVALMPVAIEAGNRWGFLVYAAVALLNLLLTPSMEAKLLFVAFFGYYPVLHLVLQTRSRVAEWGIKLAVFNLSMIVSYLLMLQVFGLESDAFELFGFNLPAVFLAVGNVTFVIYDLALRNLTLLYRRFLQPQLSRLFRL